MMTHDIQTALLTTVNAPYRNQPDAGELVAAFKTGNVVLEQVSSLFTVTAIEVQKAFAHEHGISPAMLSDIAEIFQDWSGQSVALIV